MYWSDLLDSVLLGSLQWASLVSPLALLGIGGVVSWSIVVGVVFLGVDPWVRSRLPMAPLPYILGSTVCGVKKAPTVSCGGLRRCRRIMGLPLETRKGKPINVE